jgi:hypothetical protein
MLKRLPWHYGKCKVGNRCILHNKRKGSSVLVRRIVMELWCGGGYLSYRRKKIILPNYVSRHCHSIVATIKKPTYVSFFHLETSSFFVKELHIFSNHQMVNMGMGHNPAK